MFIFFEMDYDKMCVSIWNFLFIFLVFGVGCLFMNVMWDYNFVSMGERLMKCV